MIGKGLRRVVTRRACRAVACRFYVLPLLKLSSVGAGAALLRCKLVFFRVFGRTVIAASGDTQHSRDQCGVVGVVWCATLRWCGAVRCCDSLAVLPALVPKELDIESGEGDDD